MEYLAPEMINKCGHNNKIDVWELGVLTYELIFGTTPFTGESEDLIKFATETYSNILYDDIYFDKFIPFSPDTSKPTIFLQSKDCYTSKEKGPFKRERSNFLGKASILEILSLLI